MNPRVRKRESAGLGDLVAQRDCPAMLEQGDRGGRPVGNRIAEVPDRVVVEDVAVLELRRAGERAVARTVVTVGAEADERSDDRAELLRLVRAQVASLHDLDLAVLVLLDEQEVDQPHDVVLLQALELLHDRAVEVVALEADDQHLDGAERQAVVGMGGQGGAHTPCRSFCFCTSNSASVSTPCSCSWPSLPSCSIVLSVIPPAAGACCIGCWACWASSCSSRASRS